MQLCDDRTHIGGKAIPQQLAPLKFYRDPNFLESTSAASLRVLANTLAQQQPDTNWWMSSGARPARVHAEYVGPEAAFQRLGVENTILFWGSARALPMEVVKPRYDEVQRIINQGGDLANTEAIRAEWKYLQKQYKLAGYYDNCVQLAQRLAEWGAARSLRYYIATGGGPGFMAAANEGAWLAEKPTIGLGISLPFEPGLNPFVTPGDWGMEFHYFFMRKYWMLYLCKALVLMPGGFGTMDEMWEALTLVQTGRVKKQIPVIAFGREFWEPVLHPLYTTMEQFGTVSPFDRELITIVDTVPEAFAVITAQLHAIERAHRNGR